MLRLSNVVKDYEIGSEKKRILDGINLAVNDGEILGITGRSGSGKTTLLRIIRGVEDFDGGIIDLDGNVITPESGYDGKRFLNLNTAIHLQRSFGLWAGPAIENIIRKLNFFYSGDESLPSEDSPYYEDLYNTALSYLKLVGLENKALHSSNFLSGGEKQRLILARQLSAKPRALLLDEPVTMTGPDTKQEILDVIKSLKNRLNIPILVISHLPEIHMYLSDRVIYLEDQKIIDEGEPENMLKNFLKKLPPSIELSDVHDEKPCIKVQNLSRRLSLIRVGEVLNIKNLSLDINEGEITAFIGSSGAGKTTLLKMIEGLHEPDNGKICYLNNGEWVDISHYSLQRMELRRKISLMHQEFILSPHSTLREQIAFKLKIKRQGAIGYARKKADELGISDELLDLIYKLPDMSEDEKSDILQKLGVTENIYYELFPEIEQEDVESYAREIFDALDLSMDVLDKTTYQMSGGEHVRAFIALSMSTSPEILMLDEPFGDLDPITLRDVTNSLKSINKNFGTTIVLVSHHMDFVNEVAHRAILVNNGGIEMDGEPNKVCRYFINQSNAVYLNQSIKDLAE
ncbi:ATP-binding cassette domain-containing protein [Methanohalobium sp.]|uniref:ATP-binding cassette domain-containing protein n=1 Tax=Methanohalobium sp. TaxID=2837493 RepID=UPI0025F72708|nr:ATP-binding cassette domain-containing protein [Methanohalobium sp.]